MQHAIPRARVESTHGTDLGPGPGLAAACSAAQVHTACMLNYACTLFWMTCNIVSDIHAACHAARTRIVLAWDRSRPRSGLAAA